jgi:hypothetical protein
MPKMLTHAVALALTTASAHASDAPPAKRIFLVTAGNLLNKCKSNDAKDNAFCMGYVGGVVDGATNAAVWAPALEVNAPHFDPVVSGPALIDKVVSILELVKDGKIPGRTLDEEASAFVILGIRRISKDTNPAP